MFGTLRVSVPRLQGSSYHVEQGVDMSVDAVCALKVVGANASAFDLQPGRTVRLVLAMATSFEASDCLRSATEIVVMHADQLDRLWREHAAWWDRYWNQSEVGIGDPVIEQRYYLSNYVMASASRNLDFPPSIFGTWVTTDDPAWFGDYHLNYNHQAPYYGLYSSNHIEQADPADSPCIAFMDRGQWYARSLQGCRGVYYPVGIGPKGIETTRVNPPRFPWHSAFAWQTDGQGLFHGQKSNTSFISSQQARSSRGSNDWTPPSGVRTCPAPAVAPAPLPAVPVIASAPAVSLAAEPV
jgi:hypothetical protein